MPQNLTGVNAFTDPVVMPEDGDDRNAASVEQAFQALTNRTHHSKLRLDALTPRVDALDPAIRKVMIPLDAFVPGNITGAPWIRLQQDYFEQPWSATAGASSTIYAFLRAAKGTRIKRVRMYGEVESGGTITMQTYKLTYATGTGSTGTKSPTMINFYSAVQTPSISTPGEGVLDTEPIDDNGDNVIGENDLWVIQAFGNLCSFHWIEASILERAL